MVTIREVAEAAKVSRATAARALNRYGYVGDATAERVRAAAARLGYQTNRVAQALRSGQLPIVGFVPGDIQNPFFATIARDLETELRKSRYNVVIASSDDNVEQEKELLETLKALSVPGFILAPASSRHSEHIVRLAEAGTPLVLVDRVSSGVRADSVIVDNESGARRAVDYLVGRGHNRVGILTDEARIFTARQRMRGYRAALRKHGIEPEESLVSVSRSTVGAAVDATIRLLRQRRPPTAVFAVDSLLTQGALLAIRSLGLSIPYDVSIVGFDDFDLATFVDPQITVVAQPVAEIGTLAARMIVRRLQGGDGPPQTVKLDTKLVERGSVATLARRH